MRTTAVDDFWFEVIPHRRNEDVRTFTGRNLFGEAFPPGERALY